LKAEKVINQLDALLKAKDLLIKELVKIISVLENFNTSDDDSDTLNVSEIADYEPEASTSTVNAHILSYYFYDFKTEHKVGLKIHKSKSHKYKCENCDLFFENCGYPS
jgi:hypothetical protein